MRRHYSPFLVTVVLTLMLFSIAPALDAQNTDPSNDTGLHAYETYEGARENINLGSGNVLVTVPLLTLHGRNGHNYSVSLMSNSQSWSPYSGWVNKNIGLVVTRKGNIYFHPSGTTSPAPGITCVTGYQLTDETGGVHTFSNMQSNCMWSGGGPNQGMREPQNDVLSGSDDRGEGINADINGCTLTMKDGTWFPLLSGSGGCPLIGVIGGSAAHLPVMVDSNGNQITIGASDGSVSSYSYVGGGDLFPAGTDTDTLGRGITYSGGTIKYYDSNGVQRAITLNVQNFTLSCAFGAPGNNAQPRGSANVITGAVLPNGLTYIFQYDGCGSLSKIVYPSGGYARYVFDYSHYTHGYGFGPGVQTVTDIELIQKYVCRAASVTPGATSTGTGNTCPVAEDLTTYSPTVGGCNNSANTVTDALGNIATYQFVGYQCAPVPSPVLEGQRQIYQGSSTLLRTIQTTYKGTTGAYPGSQTTILPNGLQTQVQWDYWCGCSDDVKEKREYGWGQGAPGALLRKTDYGQNYCDARPPSETVYDGSGNKLAQTIYEFDNYTAGLSSSGVGGSLNPTYPARCNVTAIQRWRNTDGATLTTRMQYDDAGNVLSVTDPLSHTTTTSYADNWGNSACAPSIAAAYPTQETDPAGLVTKHSYNSCTGTVASATDPNNQLTILSYDLMDRLAQTTLPDGGQSSTCFSEVSGATCHSSSYPLKVVSTQKVTSSLNKVATTVLDGLARVTQTQSNSDPDGATYVDTTYDSAEHKSTVSNPYRSTSDASYGITTYQYDGLDRVFKVIPPDGKSSSNNVSTSFDGLPVTGNLLNNCTIVTDAAGNQRRSCSDALGRLMEVDEPGNVPVPGTPGTGSVTIGGSEQSTQYTCGPNNQQCTMYDGGTITVTVNGTAYQYSYSQNDTPTTIASGLASSMNSGTLVAASPNGGVISMTAKTIGTATNYSLTTSVGWNSSNFPSPSFSGAPSGPNFTGGTNGNSGSGSPSINSPLVTLYQYDVLNNLLRVDQKGNQPSDSTQWRTRTFTYDSLSHLLTANNPESGRVSYTYDADGNLLSRISPASNQDGYPGTGSATVSGSEQSKAGPPATSGTGSVTFSGTLQSKQVLSQAAAAGTGSVSVSGTLQSTQAQTQSAAAGAGSVTISGSEQTYTFDPCPPHGSCPQTVYDGGTITVTVNGVQAGSTGYGGGSTPSSLATALASSINGNSSSPVTATASGATVNLTAKTTGASTNYSLSASSVTQNTQYFSSTSFPVSTSGSTLTGGRNATYSTIYDSGSCTITVNSHGDSTSWSGSGTTNSSIASALASSINGDGSASITAGLSGSTVNLTAKTTGAATNYSFSSSCTYDTSHFSSPSFSTSNSGSALTGGQNAVYNTIYDSGTSTITVNGHADSVSWSGSGTTTSSIASGLASVINADSSASVSASTSGSTVNLTTKTTGASTNYSLSSSSTYDSTDFSSPSFSSSNSGSALTGGQNAGATIYDSGSVWITINGTQYSVGYVQSSTTSSLASSLASAISAGSLANASASGSGITITARTDGSGTNYSLSSGSSTSQPGSFSSASFSVSVSSLTGGKDPGGSTITTSYSYEADNRLTQKSYSDSVTPTVRYGYDGVPLSGCTVAPPALTDPYPKGRRTAMCDSAGAESWSHDTMGRPSTDLRTTNGVTKSTQYTYNLDGSVFTLIYPSGRVLTYTLKSSGTNTVSRMVSTIDSTGPINYATAASYAPQGALASLTNGGSFISSFFYNTHFQPCRVSVTTSGTAPANCSDSTTANALDYAYNFNLGSADNGNLISITNNRDNTRSQNFTYDALNRLVTAQTQTSGLTIPNANCWGLTYGYDPWGNLLSSTVSGPSGCGEPLGFSLYATASNQPSTSSTQLTGYCYDAAGNLILNSTCPIGLFTPAYSYNAENQLTGAAGVTYTYDGDGKRVEKSNGKLYWYGMSSDALDETDLQGNTNNSSFNEYVFFNRKRIARRDYQNNVFYYFADHLGTARIQIKAGQTTPCYDADFYPFGGERVVTDGCDSAYKFTSKERDSESGLDNFGARFDNSALGRFMSVDPAGARAKLGNPQGLNRYSYALNNPHRFTDPDGLYPRDQHEIFTFWLAVVAGRPDAEALAVGAGKADNFWNATTGIFGLGWVINYQKHFGKPPSFIAAGEQGGFGMHLTEDHGGPGAPHERGSWYHVWSNIKGHSVDTADSSSGGFIWGGLALGIPLLDPVFDQLEGVRRYVNHNGLTLSSISVGDQSHTFRALSPGAVARPSETVGGVTINIYDEPDLGSESDPNVQAIRNRYILTGNDNELDQGEELYIYRINLSQGTP